MAKIVRQALDASDFATVPLAVIGVSIVALSAPSATTFVNVGLGFVAWTLIEYAVHRALHNRRFPQLRAFHMKHHQHPTQATGGTLWSTLVILALMLAAILWPGFAPGIDGLLVGYFVFIVLHHFEHHAGELRGPIIGRLAVHHHRHHHARPRGCFGVTTSAWDRLFRTL